MELATLSTVVQSGGLALVALCFDCTRELIGVCQRSGNEEPADYGHRAYYGPEWKKTRDAIVVRDNGECQDQEHQAAGGSELTESLVVHHIKPLKEFAGDYVAANQSENLVTLCTICHGRWHAELTRAKNQEQRV